MSPASSGWATYSSNCESVAGPERVPQVLLAHRDDGLVDQRVAQPRHLHPRTGGRVGAARRCARAPSAGWPRPTRRSPRSAGVESVGVEPSTVRSEIGTVMAIVCTLYDLSPSTPGASRRRDEVQVLERAQVGQVEHRAQVDVEAVEALAGEHVHLAGLRRGARPAWPAGVVRRRPGPDVARRAASGSGPSTFGARRGGPGHRVDLAAVPVRVVEASDRTGVVEERVRVVAPWW